MDILDLMPNIEDVVTTLKHPKTGEVLTNEDGSPMTITRYSPYSKEYEQAADSQMDVALKKARLSEDKDISFADSKAMGVKFLADTTKSWNITFSKEQPKFSAKKALEIYSLPAAFWIKSQLEEDEAKVKDFM